MSRLLGLVISISVLFFLTACGTIPRVVAQERMFLNLSLEFLGEYQLPKMSFKDTPVGGLSAITYDPRNSRFYALSDDRSQLAPARFYTLNLNLASTDTGKVSIDKVEVENVTFLTNERGETFPPGTIDSESIALSPKQTLFISSEGVPSNNVDPFIREFDLKSGRQLQGLIIPSHFLPSEDDNGTKKSIGVQENLGFEALTLNPNGLAKEDPFRLFSATESALLQDYNPKVPEEKDRIRLLHYSINPIGQSFLLAEHLYVLDPSPSDARYHGLSELTALDQEGYLLSLERTLSLSGFGAKIFQLIIGDATDISRIASLQGDLGQVEPIEKNLLLDLTELGIDLDNLEGMTFGPNLPDGSKTLVLVSDDNFEDNQITQFLLFRLVK
jgi:hypothetical protein